MRDIEDLTLEALRIELDICVREMQNRGFKVDVLISDRRQMIKGVE